MGNRVVAALFFFLLLLAGGTLGYHLIEGWSPLDSLYMTVITLSTVGFGELRPLSPVGKIFTSALILLGVGTLAYAATKTTEALVERRLFYRRRKAMEIKRLTDHVIVCGFGRMGETVSEQLRSRRIPLVVIDRQPSLETRLDDMGIPYLIGDATDDAVLQQAGVSVARALAATMPHDADNLFVTLSARRMNAGLTIITRASREKSVSKMMAAGATRVLNPFLNGGRLMARQLLHPSVTEFMDVITEGEGSALSLEEVRLEAGSTLAGVMLRDAPIRKEMDVIVVGVRRPDQGLVFNPPPDLAPQVGDVLVVLGRPENLRRLERLAEGSIR